MNELTQQLLLFGALIFVLGMVGFLTRRSMILMFLSLEMMLAGVSLNLVAFSRLHQNYQGQLFAIMILAVAACEAALALALVVSLHRRRATLDVNAWTDINETPKLPGSEPTLSVPEPTHEYPKLTPAGLDPLVQPMPVELIQANWKETADRVEGMNEVTHRA
jgi:NADH-quinone oxidoreductase subunit K